MDRRLELHEILKAIPGVREVYFQPPESVRLEYPCIIYNRSYIDAQYANNYVYKIRKKYSVTVIDTNPDSLIPDILQMNPFLPQCAFDRHYTADNLYHDAFTLYF